MKQVLYILAVVIIFVSHTFSQINPGARQISLGNSDVAQSDDVFCLFNNPSGLRQMNWREVGIYYSPAPFGLTELSNAYLAYHEPVSIGSIGFGFSTYGFELFRQSGILLGYSCNYQSIYFGLAVEYMQTTISNYGSENSVLFNIGGLIYLSETMKWGFAIHNFSGATIGKESDQLPMTLKFGFSYEPRNELCLNFALDKELNNMMSLTAGIEYNLVRHFYLRTGFTSQPDRFSAGMGLNYSIMQFDYAVFNHAELGLTHQAGLIIHFTDDEPRSIKIKKNRAGK
ncbi:MAG: hypothetical protein WCJ01_01280 [Ignavibacteria bacterium]